MVKAYKNKVWRHILAFSITCILALSLPSSWFALVDEGHYVLGESFVSESNDSAAIYGHSEQEDVPDLTPLGASDVTMGISITPFAVMTVSTFSELQAAVATAGVSHTIYIAGDIDFNSSITIPAGRAITLLSDTASSRTLALDSSFSANRHFIVRGTLTLDSTLILDGSNPSSPGTPYAGGVNIASGGMFELNGGTIQNCRANEGGGVYATNGSTFGFGGGLITGCVADSRGGGIFFVSSSNYTWSDGVIEKCEAYSGGGIYIQNDNNTVEFIMGGNAVIDQCKALIKYGNGSITQGGGVYVNRGALRLSGNSRISNCLADSAGQGGGIFSSGLVYLGDGSSSPVIQGCIAGAKLNFATDSPGSGLGGGIYATNQVYMYPGSQLNNCHSSNNGGGIYATGGALAIYGGTIDGCTSSNGGGIHTGSPMNMQSGTIQNCDAYYHGGAIQISGVSATLEQDVVIRGCSAGTPDQNKYWGCKGGGIFVTSSASSLLTLNGTTVEDNHAVTRSTEVQRNFGSGGGIYVDTNGRAVLNGAIIRNNSAAHHGGGVFTKKYSNLTTNSSVVFTGNYVQTITQPRYRVPADTIMANPAIYPCTSAQSVSPSSAQLDGRMFPLNNWDINYSSYKVAYEGNGGTDNAMTKYEMYIEYAPFATSDNPTSTITYTILDNDRSSNGSLFEFSKGGSAFGAWSNLNKYKPSDASYKEYGPSSPNPTQNLTAAEMFSRTVMPELTYYALYTKKLTVEKNVLGSYGDLTRVFVIDVDINDAAGKPVSGSPWSLSFKHGDSRTETIYEDCEITVIEQTDPSALYTVGYNDSTGPAAATYNNQSLAQLKYSSFPEVTVVVENTRNAVVPSGVSIGNSLGAVIITLGAASFFLFAWLLKTKRRNILRGRK